MCGPGFYLRDTRVFTHLQPISGLHFSHVTKAGRTHAVRARRQNGRLEPKPRDFSALSRMDRSNRGKELQTESYPFSGSKVELGFFGALGFYRPQHSSSSNRSSSNRKDCDAVAGLLRWASMDRSQHGGCSRHRPLRGYYIQPCYLVRVSVPKVGVGMVHKPAYVKTTAF